MRPGWAETARVGGSVPIADGPDFPSIECCLAGTGPTILESGMSSRKISFGGGNLAGLADRSAPRRVGSERNPTSAELLVEATPNAIPVCPDAWL